jgi:hypothetical protein
MNGEVRLRETFQAQTARITDAPSLAAGGRITPGPARRTALAIALATLVVLGAGAAVARVLDSQDSHEGPVITLLDDPYTLASGDASAPWELLLYQARVTRPDGQDSVNWCLDFNGPGPSDQEADGPYDTNACHAVPDNPTTFGVTFHISMSESLAVLFGEVSPKVEQLQITTADGVSSEVDLTLPPEGMDTGVRYYATEVPAGTVELIARDANGEVLDQTSVG